jgi:hypothetical protein
MSLIPSFFGALADSQNMQAYIDTSIDNLYGKSVWRNWLTPGIPQVSLTFNTAIGRDRIEAAASIVDQNAPAPLRSRPALEFLTGKIPAIKQKFRMEQDDMRAFEVLQAMNINGAQDALIARLADDVSKCATAGDKRVDIMMLQALSTFSIDLSMTNNPDGVNYGTVDMLAKSYQTLPVGAVWTDSVNANPVLDIQNTIQNVWNTYGRQFGRILMSWELWINFQKSAKVQDFLKSFFNIGKSNGTYSITLDNINTAFAANGWPPIEIINYAVGIEEDGVEHNIKPFNSNNVVLAPSGPIGTLENAISMESRRPVAGKTYATFDKTLVSKWLESDPLVEFTAMEMYAFPVINTDGIFILKTNATS